MFCPCCAGRATRSNQHPDQSGNVDVNGDPPAPEGFGIHTAEEPCKLRIPSDPPGVPFPVIVSLVNVPIFSFHHFAAF